MNMTPNQEIQQLLNEAYQTGRIFSALFVKADGTERFILCRCGVKKHLSGRGLHFDAKEKKLLPVWDLQTQAYRFINMNTVKELRINGRVYTTTE